MIKGLLKMTKQDQSTEAEFIAKVKDILGQRPNKFVKPYAVPGYKSREMVRAEAADKAQAVGIARFRHERAVINNPTDSRQPLDLRGTGIHLHIPNMFEAEAFLATPKKEEPQAVETTAEPAPNKPETPAAPAVTEPETPQPVEPVAEPETIETPEPAPLETVAEPAPVEPVAEPTPEPEPTYPRTSTGARVFISGH